MNKKLLGLILSALTAFSLTSAVGCAEVEENFQSFWDRFGSYILGEHEHTWEATITEPTCTEKGYTTYTCVCGNSYIDNYVDIVDHTLGNWQIVKNSTCTNIGEKRRECQNKDCSYYEMQSIAKIEHTYVPMVTAPTCAEKGYTTYTCACGDNYVDNYVNTIAHSLGNWYIIKEATCTEAGEQRRDCQNGDCIYYEVAGVAKTAHSYTKEVASERYFAEEANCEHKTKYYKSCVCGLKGTTTFEYGEYKHPCIDTWIFNESHHWKELTCDCSASPTYLPHSLNDKGSCTVCNAQVKPTDGIYYDLSADGTYYEVIAYEGTETKIVIANTYNGLPVKTICKEAFFQCRNLTSIVIGNNVTSIGDYAFYYCSKLTSVVIPDSVTTIGDEAFQYCRSLTNVIIPDSVISIGSYAFEYCSGLTNVTIPDSVTSIGSSAFSHCASLTNVTIPDSVTSIGVYAFFGCNKLQFTEYGNCKYLGNENNPYFALIVTTSDNYSSYTIHENTKIIADYAFQECSRMTNVTIPDNVTSIGVFAFDSCSSLTSVTIPDSVTSIGKYVLSSCYNLKNIYYKGTAKDWSNISIGDNNGYLTNATRYYYSESKPTEEGNFWHYDENGNVVVW